MATVSFGDLLEPGLRQMFQAAYASKEAMAAQIFSTGFRDWQWVYGYNSDPVIERLVKNSRKRGQEESQALKTMYQKVYG